MRRTQNYGERGLGLKMLLCAVAMVFGVSFGWTPAVPDTILLPDSLGPLRPPYHLAFGSSTDNIYVASETSDIIVVDGNTFQRMKRINTGTPVGGALLVTQHNRLYCSYPLQGRIGVIDCATNNVVDSIQVGTRPTLLCYSSGSDKLYCGDTIDRTVTAIDCATNTVLGVISVGQGLIAMVYDPTTDKVYAGTRDALLAISCSTDTIAATISSIKWARSFCVNQRRQKLYMTAGYRRPLHDTVYVVSTQFDSVVAALPCDVDTLPRLVCNEATDRLYVQTQDYLTRTFMWEYDCAADTLIRYTYIGIGLAAWDIGCDTVKNGLLCLFRRQGERGGLYTVDCATLSVTSVNELADAIPCGIAFDPARCRVMCSSRWDGYAAEALLEVFGYKYDTMYVVGAVPLNGWKWVMCHNPVTGKLYYRWGTRAGGVGVIDERTNRVVTQSLLGQAIGGAEMTHSRTSNKFYFHSEDGLGVMDGSTGRLLKLIDIGDGGSAPFPCWSPVGNKVYCYASVFGARKYIAVIDCDTDSVVRTMDVYDFVKGFEYLDNGHMLCVLLEALTLIDCQTDSVVVDSAIGGIETITHTGDGEKFYAVFNRRLEVRSSSTLSLLSATEWDYGYYGSAGFLVYSDTTRKLYWFTSRDSVLVIDGRSDTVVARLKDSIAYERACLDHTGRYLFCTSYSDRNLRVYDTQSDSLVGVYPNLPEPPVRITPNPELGCVYVGCRDVILVYPDVPPGIEETPYAEVRATRLGPTVLRGILHLPLALGVERRASSVLLDVSGRKVMDLQPGTNDVRALAPGVYFIRAGLGTRGEGLGKTQKVVVTR